MKIRLIGLTALIGASPCFGGFADLRPAWQLLDEDSEVLVNSQGLAQHDLSIQGGSYSGSGMSLNGLRLKVPYSAHLNSELPVLGNLLGKPAVETGLDNLSGHLTGTAAFNTQPLEDTQQAYAGLGTKEHYAAGVYGSTEFAGGFLDLEKARQIDDGANGMERAAGGAFFKIPANDWTIDIITAGQSKEFEGLGYFDSTNLTEYQVDDSLVFAGATQGDLDDAYLRVSALYRDVRYQEDSDTGSYADIYSKYFTAAAEGRTLEIQHIALKLRADLEHERVSGDLDDHRTRGTVLLQPEARFERFTVTAGLNAVFQTGESAEFLPAAGADWLLTDNSRISLSYTETEQQPDYQILESNPELLQQHARNTALAFKQFLSESSDWHIGAFHRTLENASDWIAGSAVGLGRVETIGLDASIGFYPTENLMLKAFYQWAEKNNTSSDGLYESDYPEHLLKVSAQWRFLGQFGLLYSQTARLQAENAQRTSKDFGAPASLGLQYDPTFAKNVRVSFSVDNLWGSDFQSIPGQKPRPATLFTRLAVSW